MRISHIRMAGFRGFRELTHIEVPAGFLVITGKNGTGKSTIIDAIEFVLTGTIEKYPTESGGREHLRDYIWWRGSAESHFVELGLVSDEGEPIKLVRSRDDASSFPTVKAEQALCYRDFAPAESLHHLCRTTIIRDEQIASLSWDQTDTARFELVKAAVGALSPSDAAKQLAAASRSAQGIRDQVSRDAEIAATRLRAILADVQEARSEVQRTEDIDASFATVRLFTGSLTDNVADLLTAARRMIAERRSAVQAARALSRELRDFEELRGRLSDKEYQQREAQAATLVQAAEQAHEIVATQVRVAEEELAAAERISERAAALAGLVDYGERVGLEDGRCPLCQTVHSEMEYRNLLSALKARIASLAAPLLEARRRLQAALVSEEATRKALEHARTAGQEVLVLKNSVEQTHERLLHELRKLDAGIGALPSGEGFEQYLAGEERRLAKCEEAMFVLEASRSVDRMSRLETQAETAREEAEKASVRVGTVERAMSSLTQGEHEARRVSGEIADARLAAISPLLSELYYRLRPHRRWREIDYQIRGDVRRFLTLSVGDGVNPQFVFSSGERRVAGLAFLLAVSLSRPWCRLKTLALDDPIQHIDDFRALHLVEVLSALRKSDRQILCAVEDQQVADLLCRRLRSTFDLPGGRLELDWTAESGARIESQKSIRPLPADAVLSSSSS
jgi:chromosome segregation protein